MKARAGSSQGSERGHRHEIIGGQAYTLDNYLIFLSRVSTNMYKFMGFINHKYQKNFTEYVSLYQWSIENIPDFWAAMWEFAEIKASSLTLR